MDRRTALAIGLMLIVAILPSLLFPPKRPVPETGAPADTGGMERVAPVETVTVVTPAVEARTPRIPPAAHDTSAEALVTVETSLYRLSFSTRGARLKEAVLKNYRSLDSIAPNASGPAQVIPPESRFLEHQLVFGNDTIPLADWTFEPSATELTLQHSDAELEWVGRNGPLTVRLTYTFRPERYLFDVRGAIHGVDVSGLALVGLGPRMAYVEADSASDFHAYGVVTKASKTENLAFRKLDPGERRELGGPFEWVAVKSKYFVGALLTIEQQFRFGGAVVTGGQRVGKHAIRADVVASLPAPGGAFAYSVFVGPQEYRLLARIGHDFEDVNPYGWILRPIIRPFANLIVRILLWMHETLALAYGWVLILFGIAVRILVWPLNQKAMRSSMAMQAVQPELKAVQERYKQDPQRMQQEVMKLYKHHRVNPLGGCLPVLIQMPFLFALFFVFRETIEFRGVPFLWLPDLSQADPIYIIPILMGLSMFAVSKLGQLGVPPNPQMKMMLYLMPAVLTFVFLQLSAGLNLYYATSNIASIPQQWLIARDRLKRAGKTKA